MLTFGEPTTLAIPTAVCSACTMHLMLQRSAKDGHSQVSCSADTLLTYPHHSKDHSEIAWHEARQPLSAWCRRNKAVRLVANRLYAEHSLQKVITDFAASKAKEVLPARKPPRPALQAPSVNDGGSCVCLHAF